MGGFRDEAPQNSTMARLINPAQRSMIKAQRAERWATAGDRWGNGLRVSGVHGPAVSKPRPALNPSSCWPVGLMDKASASGAGDSRFESWAGQALTGVSSRSSGSQRLEAQFLKWISPSRSWCKARLATGCSPEARWCSQRARAIGCRRWRSPRRPCVDSSAVAARL